MRLRLPGPNGLSPVIAQAAVRPHCLVPPVAAAPAHSADLSAPRRSAVAGRVAGTLADMPPSALAPARPVPARVAA
jgi:hypothetical protein